MIRLTNHNRTSSFFVIYHNEDSIYIQYCRASTVLSVNVLKAQLSLFNTALLPLLLAAVADMPILETGMHSGEEGLQASKPKL